MINIFWFRRDLRLEDNAGLYHALTSGLPVLPIFIYDTEILDKLPEKQDVRIEFIHKNIGHIKSSLQKLGSSLFIYHGKPLGTFKEIVSTYNVKNVFTNHDYEPYARKRDQVIEGFLKDRGISFHTYKDQVIFEKNEILKDNGRPYTVYTPYMKKWKQKYSSYHNKNYDTGAYVNSFFRTPPLPDFSMEKLGFASTSSHFPSNDINPDILKNYEYDRDYPGIDGTSKISIHLRFGTVSIRKLVRLAREHSEKWLNELIWREFYMGNILWHFPHSIEKSFKPKYDHIEWNNNEKEFQAWCEGKTGYPIVDAGMRELNETGFMHNRSRMITASFLVKHLLIDWRWGEAYFAQKLHDYEMASNVGGWQWATGSGCDAAPYFRIFNPTLQAQKFDPDKTYVRKWIPEIDSPAYPRPIVDLKYGRNRALKTYKHALENA